MATVSESIPSSLQPEVDAALAWFNETHQENFDVTGIVDPDESITSASPRELRLVLCSGDSCLQRSFLVRVTDGEFAVSLVSRDSGAMEDDCGFATDAELDPPPGARRGWLASVMRRHEFVVLVFYRGFW